MERTREQSRWAKVKKVVDAANKKKKLTLSVLHSRNKSRNCCEAQTERTTQKSYPLKEQKTEKEKREQKVRERIDSSRSTR